MLKAIKELAYKERLKSLGHFNLKSRGIKDMTDVYKTQDGNA